MKRASRKSRRSVDSIDWPTVGRRIRELRGIEVSQQDFAALIGVSQNYLSVMEHGKVEIGAAILLRVSQKFGKSMEWLLTGEERGGK